ncbi:EF-hand calcium-binding domain-containing protein 6-like [Gigantopelta aegis]|uniref:EF-hand calcium-binding domain-containing protein 6-like n=1 Tax=Gigantopelta aegis TaxID=1735272 RepID=UPI001B88BD47|nr:EF-hand calcium-binding domain-containing protein 6-like [Gigantopelta aegis]
MMECDLKRMEKHVEVARLKVEEDFPALECEREADRARKLQEQSRAAADCYEQYLEKITCLLKIIKPKVLDNEECLKRFFETKDRLGSSYIMIDEMLTCMNKLSFPISDIEKLMLCRHFDLESDGRFYYLKFMGSFNRLPETSSEQTKSLPVERKPRIYNYQRTVEQALAVMHDKLLKEFKNLWRVFQKYDTNKDGVVSMEEFKKILRFCGIQFSKDDLYHIVAEFDTNMNGVVSYDEFLRAVLKVNPNERCEDYLCLKSKTKSPKSKAYCYVY